MGDYSSVLTATKTIAADISADIAKWDDHERESVTPEGSLFNKHRQTVARCGLGLGVGVGGVGWGYG